MLDNSSAYITQISPLSSHDGPGMRTTVFMKGCPLRCQWCHNPETWSLEREIEWDEKMCIGCRTCEGVCKNGAINFEAPFLHDASKCILCGECVGNCPSKALKFIGTKYDVDTLCDELLKDIDLTKSLGGGITFSGGEPALQYIFLDKVLTKLKPHNIHIALDTCGYVLFKNYEILLPNIDLVLFDIKDMNNENHREFTGQGNEMILDNLVKIDKFIRDNHLTTKIWIRTPLIPTMTASDENIKSIANYLNDNAFQSVERWDMCAFNNLCKVKYKKLGMKWSLKDFSLLKRENLERYLEIANSILRDKIEIDSSGITSRE